MVKFIVVIDCSERGTDIELKIQQRKDSNKDELKSAEQLQEVFKKLFEGEYKILDKKADQLREIEDKYKVKIITLDEARRGL
jgi:hypothetical protein